MSLIIDELFSNQDLKYQKFSIKLIPNVDPKTIIGVRSPVIKKIAKRLIEGNDYQSFINNLPHQYHDENMLHMYILSMLKVNPKEIIILLDNFIPYLTNWSVTDTYSNIVFNKYPEEGLEYINKLFKSNQPYAIRLGLVILMKNYLKENYNSKILDLPKIIINDDYYVKMAIAWFYSKALIDHYNDVIKILNNKELNVWIHNKTISKAIDSYQINIKNKDYLKKLKIIKEL